MRLHLVSDDGLDWVAAIVLPAQDLLAHPGSIRGYERERGTSGVVTPEARRRRR